MATYWTYKKFKTQKAMNQWLNKNSHKVQWHEVFINNGYCIEYKDLRIIDID